MIIQNHNLHRQLMNRRRRQLKKSHLETPITHKTNMDIITPPKRRPNRSWKPKPHRTRTTRTQPIIPTLVLIKLGRPHLMLANIR